MPHICLRCKKRIEAEEGKAPRCPECGGTRFAFISARRLEMEAQEPVPEQPSPPPPQEPDKEPDPVDPDQLESIRILEPGRYDLNLIKLAESDDRIIRIGKDAHYRLDLNSMVRSKKKEND